MLYDLQRNELVERYVSSSTTLLEVLGMGNRAFGLQQLEVVAKHCTPLYDTQV